MRQIDEKPTDESHRSHLDRQAYLDLVFPHPLQNLFHRIRKVKMADDFLIGDRGRNSRTADPRMNFA